MPWVFVTLIFIAITFLKNRLFTQFITLECKYNKLQFGLRISSIEVSKQKLHISTQWQVCNKTPEGNPSRSNSFLKINWIQSVFQKALVSVQPYSAEEIPRTALKAWKRRFLTELPTSLPLLIFFPFCLHDRQTGCKFLLLFYSDRAIYWAWTDKE